MTIAYLDETRAAIADSLASLNIRVVECSSFYEAKSHALRGRYKGIVLDLATMIKAKEEERVIANMMTSIYPTLRVKTMGSVLVPMVMSSDAKQEDNSLDEFFTKTCAKFSSRTLRSNKRRNICIPTRIGEERGFTQNVSWSGVFVVDMKPERFSIGDEVSLELPDFGVSEDFIITRVQRWGERRPSGIGLRFKGLDQELESILFTLLKNDKIKDHDKLVALGE